jgi:hypothetical protein
MIQTQSQNEEIRKIGGKVRWKAMGKVWSEVWYKFGYEVGRKVGDGFKVQNNVRRKLFL